MARINRTTTVSPPRFRCAIYARVSSELQDVENSVERQVEACTRWAERNNGAILPAHVYVDEAISAALMLTRPALQRLLAMLRAPGALPFDVLLVDEDSRLDRGGKLASLMESFASRGVRVIAADGGVDLTDERQRLMIHVKAGMNEEYLRELARRTREGLANKVRHGFHAGGSIFGFRLVPVWPAHIAAEQRSRDNRTGTRIEVDPEQAEIVREIFQRFAEGAGLREITFDLNRRSVRSPRGKAWCHTAIRAILQNPKYRGAWNWNARCWTKKPESLFTDDQRERVARTNRPIRVPRLRPQDDRIEVDREDLRIVSDAIWSEVARRFEASRHTFIQTRQGKRPTRRLLSGVLTCECGSPIVVIRSREGEVGRSEYGCSRVANRGPLTCPNHGIVRESELSEHLLGYVRRELLDPKVVELALREMERQAVERNKASREPARVAELRKIITGLEAEVARYVDAIGAGVDVASVRDALTDRQRRLDDARAELATETQPTKGRTFHALTRAEIVKRLDRIWADLNSGNVAKARTLLSRLLGEARVRLVGEGKEKAWGVDLPQAQGPLALLIPEVRRGITVVAGAGSPRGTAPKNQQLSVPVARVAASGR